MLQHQSAAPYLANGIRDPFARDVGRGSMNRLEQTGMNSFWIDIGRRRNADCPGTGGTEVGKNIAEQVTSDNNVEPIGMQNKIRAQNINVIFVDLHLWIIRGHLGDSLIPVWHADKQAVRLCRRR